MAVVGNSRRNGSSVSPRCGRTLTRSILEFHGHRHTMSRAISRLCPPGGPALSNPHSRSGSEGARVDIQNHGGLQRGILRIFTKTNCTPNDILHGHSCRYDCPTVTVKCPGPLRAYGRIKNVDWTWNDRGLSLQGLRPLIVQSLGFPTSVSGAGRDRAGICLFQCRHRGPAATMMSSRTWKCLGHERADRKSMHLHSHG